VHLYCAVCGAPRGAGGFCGQCGAAFRTPAGPSGPPSDGVPASRAVPLGIAAAVLLVATGVGTALALGRDDGGTPDANPPRGPADIAKGNDTNEMTGQGFESAPVDQPSECTVDARALEDAEGHEPGTYNTVELREPFADEDVAVNYPICWYSHDGTAFPSTTLITAPYGMGPADDSSPLMAMKDTASAEDADRVLAELCPIEVQRPGDYGNVLICGMDAFVLGPTRWYQHADLVQENSIDDDVNSLNDEELDQIAPVLELLSTQAQ